MMMMMERQRERLPKSSRSYHHPLALQSTSEHVGQQHHPLAMHSLVQDPLALQSTSERVHQHHQPRHTPRPHHLRRHPHRLHWQGVRVREGERAADAHTKK
jgi:hypothetical protein